MAVEVKVSVNAYTSEMDSFIAYLATSAVQGAAGRVRDRAKANITRAGRVDSGLMRNATVAEVRREGQQAVGMVVTRTPYASYQHEGTANDGAGFIYPRRARTLRFRGAGGAYVFAPKVRGVKGVPFLSDALDTLTQNDFT